jgi:hypothetical protein
LMLNKTLDWFNNKYKIIYFLTDGGREIPLEDFPEALS